VHQIHPALENLFKGPYWPKAIDKDLLNRSRDGRAGRFRVAFRRERVSPG